MSGRRVRRAVSETAQTVSPFAANATNSVPHRKILLLAVFATLLVVVTVPILSRTDTLPVVANSTLKCYDSTGNYEPCVTPASASPSRFNGRTTGTHQPPNWAATALYLQAGWATAAVDQPPNWTTSAPAARQSSTSGKRRALAICGGRLVPCLFSAVRRGLTHIASAAAIVGQHL